MILKIRCDKNDLLEDIVFEVSRFKLQHISESHNQGLMKDIKSNGYHFMWPCDSAILDTDEFESMTSLKLLSIQDHGKSELLYPYCP